MDRFLELDKVEELAKIKRPYFHAFQLASIEVEKECYPIWGFRIGPDDPTLPTLGIFGGVHGLEKIGSHVAINYLQQIASQLAWDKELQFYFTQARIICIPIVNPGGMAKGTRSNPNGVDLMRNAPVESTDAKFWPICGQKLSPKIPWYRGEILEKEAQVLIDLVQSELFPSKLSLALDIHSGFGLVDRLWYPYAKTHALFPYYEEAQFLKQILDQTYPHHIYRIGAQAETYTTHGDLWDYLVDMFWKQKQKTSVFIPWTLELGSWQWVKKRPIQALSLMGIFNPIKQHRYARIMRRHILLIELWRKLLLHSNFNVLLKEHE